MVRIIVGFDGSNSARQTVAWALEEAEVHGWDLKVITVLEQQPVPSTWGAPVYVPVKTHDLDSLKTNAQQAVDDIVNTRHRQNQAGYFDGVLVLAIAYRNVKPAFRPLNHHI